MQKTLSKKNKIDETVEDVDEMEEEVKDTYEQVKKKCEIQI